MDMLKVCNHGGFIIPRLLTEVNRVQKRLQGLELVESELKTSHQKYEQKELLIEERYQEMFKREVNENMSKLANALRKVEDLEGQKRSMQSDMSTLQVSMCGPRTSDFFQFLPLIDTNPLPAST